MPSALQGPILVCLIGPPASGKTTLARLLAIELDAPVVRPRDAIRKFLAAHPECAELFPAVNDLGWVPDPAMGLAVRAELDQLDLPGSIVILENLPWDALQLADLQRIADVCHGQLLMLHLTVALDVTAVRGNNRRVCTTCEQDEDPHTPAIASAEDLSRYAQCGDMLSTRPDDQHQRLSERIRGHVTYIDSILRLAEAAQIPVAVLNSGQDPQRVLEQALRTIPRQCRSRTH